MQLPPRNRQTTGKRQVPPHTHPKRRTTTPATGEKKRPTPPLQRGRPEASAPRKPGTKEDTQSRDDALWAAEARRLGVDPAEWVRVEEYWSETDDANEEDTLDGYKFETLTRRDLKTLKEGGELTGDIASEIARRLTDGAPHGAFLDSAFLEKVAPRVGRGSRCRRQYWTRNIGDGAGSRVGTAKTKIIARHYAPKYWCCATADMTSRRLTYYDPYYPDPNMRALVALGGYVDQVAAEQGVRPEIGATTFERKL